MGGFVRVKNRVTWGEVQEEAKIEIHAFYTGGPGF